MDLFRIRFLSGRNEEKSIMAKKLAKKQKEKENTGKAVIESFLEYLCALFGMILCVVIPLYMQDGYYQIGAAKYEAYKYIFIFGMSLPLLLVLLYAVFALQEKKELKVRLQELKGTLSWTDWFVIAYLAGALLSYLFSYDRTTAFWGYQGWFMGLFSQLSFGIIYFICSRFLKDYWVVLLPLLGVTLYVFIIGILHRLLIDPLGVYENLADYYIQQFLSTLGQASWYSSFVCTVLPVGMFCYWHFDRLLLRLISGIFTFAGFATLVTQNTDSAYFAFLGAMLVFFWVSVSDGIKMRRLCELLLMFALAPKFMELLLRIHPNPTLRLDTLSSFLVFDKRIWIFAGCFGALIILFQLLQKKEKYPAGMIKKLRYVFCSLLVFLVLAWALLLFLGTKEALPSGILALTEKIPYLTWDESWGNGRGFTWEVTMKMIVEMNPFRLLFGVGPDSYAAYGYALYEDLIRIKWGSNVLTNAHNEWLNTVVNYGIVGGAAYLGIFISALVRFVKHSADGPVLLGFAASIAAYMAHNIFCYQQVLCTPFVFLFIALGEYQLRKNRDV